MAKRRAPFPALLMLFPPIQQRTRTHVTFREIVPMVPVGRANREITFLPEKRPDHLLRCRFVPPSTIDLDFADASFSLEIELLEMPVDRLKWETAQASSSGDAMIVEAVKGETIPVDSSTLRYLVDKGYARAIDKSLPELQFSRDELKAMAEGSRPPVEWYNQPERDLRLDSWK